MSKVFKDGAEGGFEVQALMYMGLLSMGYRVRGDVKSTSIFEGKRKRNARFDLVIFDDKWEPLEIIETKKPSYSIPFENSSIPLLRPIPAMLFQLIHDLYEFYKTRTNRTVKHGFPKP